MQNCLFILNLQKPAMISRIDSKKGTLLVGGVIIEIPWKPGCIKSHVKWKKGIYPGE